MKGGYCNLGKMTWVFLHRFFATGHAMVGTEREFIMRFEVGVDREPKISWFTFEAINPFEARIFYLWVKFWKNHNFVMVINFGFRLTTASRSTLHRQAMEAERKLKKIEGGKPCLSPRVV